MAKRRRDGTWEEPKALRHLRRTLTEEMALKAFTEVFGREPHPGELEMFVETYTLEMYNGGFEEWPELRKARSPGDGKYPADGTDRVVGILHFRSSVARAGAVAQRYYVRR